MTELIRIPHRIIQKPNGQTNQTRAIRICIQTTIQTASISGDSPSTPQNPRFR